MLHLFAQGAQALNLKLDSLDIERFQMYLNELKKWNRIWNLTAIIDERDIIVKHFLDCLAIAKFVDSDNILDLGTGAGFPGLVLAMVCPNTQFTLLDSSAKKVRFLKHMIVTTKVQNVKVVHSRVETYQPAQLFDCVIARAYARSSVILEQSRRLLTEQGVLKLMKGACSSAEIDEVSRAGCQQVDITDLNVPFLEQIRQLITIQL